METKNPPPYLRSLGRVLGFASTATGVLSQNLLDAHNLSLKHWTILSALWREDGLLITQIAKYRGANLPAASRIIDRMTEKGLVERRADPNDRRAARIYLTSKGKKLSPLIDLYKDVNAVLLADFSPEEADTLFDLLERVTANANAHHTKAAGS